MDEARLRDHFERESIELAHDMNRLHQEQADRAEQSGAPPDFVQTLRSMHHDPDSFAAERASELIDDVHRFTDSSEFALCELEGEFVFPVGIRMTTKELVLPGGIVMQGGTVSGGGVAVQID